MYQRTGTAWDQYSYYLKMAITNSKFAKRAETKPMSTPKGAAESHITSRATHQRLVSEIAERIAKELGLNKDYVYIAMLMHDAGHPFSAHEGEQIFNIIGRIKNTGYFHHNAKGVEVILSEDVCSKAIDMIPEIENNPELKKSLEEDFYHFLDVVISHDGEATKRDQEKEAEHYESMKDAVFTKLGLSNSANKYKFIAQDPEGRLGKVADVLAYLPTDIQDGFRLGIVDSFNDDYLEAFGTMFFDDGTLTREEKIEKAGAFLDEIKSQSLRIFKSDMNTKINKQILEHTSAIIKEANEKGINTKKLTDEEQVKLDEFVNEKIEQIRTNTSTSSSMEKNQLESYLMELREFIGKMTKVNSGTVERITDAMREYFIQDFIKNSKSTGKMGFSQKAEDLFYKIKELNYQYIVQYTKWDYQYEGQPEAALELIKRVSKGLIKSGAIRDKIYDSSIRSYITDPDALQYMNTPYREEEEYEGYRIRKKISRPSQVACKDKDKDKHKKSKGKKLKSKKCKMHRNKMLRDAYTYTRKMGQIFAIKYMNVFNAIPHTVVENVECALDNRIAVVDFLTDFQAKSNRKLRNRMIEKYGSLAKAKENKEDFIAELIEEERQKMEEKMATQLAIDFLSGMTDRGFNDLAIRTGFMTKKQAYNAKRSGRVSDIVAEHLRKLKVADQTPKPQVTPSSQGDDGQPGGR